MGLIYVGDCSFAETAESGKLSVDPWGFDVCTRIREGRTDELAAEMALWASKRNVKDEEHPSLFLTAWDKDPGRAFSRINLTFRGLFDDKPRDPEVKTGSRLQSVTLQFTDENGDLDGTSTTLKYSAPYAMCRYASKTAPLAPKYLNKVNLKALKVRHMTGDDSRALHFKRGASQNGATSSSVTLSRLANGYNAVIELDGTVECEPVGQWFQVTEQNEALIVPIGLTLSKRQVNAS